MKIKLKLKKKSKWTGAMLFGFGVGETEFMHSSSFYYFIQLKGDFPKAKKKNREDDVCVCVHKPFSMSRTPPRGFASHQNE